VSVEEIALGSDHAGLKLKEEIKAALKALGIKFTDLGTNSAEPCDYPLYARKVAESVSAGHHARGILCCGSGIGMAIAANKVRGVRAAVVHDVQSAELSRKHNDANVLYLAGRRLDMNECKPIVEAWLSTEFEGGRHQERIDNIEKPRGTDFTSSG
jgi:ribose 5-phosphate isomerase B